MSPSRPRHAMCLVPQIGQTPGTSPTFGRHARAHVHTSELCRKALASAISPHRSPPVVSPDCAGPKPSRTVPTPPTNRFQIPAMTLPTPTLLLLVVPLPLSLSLSFSLSLPLVFIYKYTHVYPAPGHGPSAWCGLGCAHRGVERGWLFGRGGVAWCWTRKPVKYGAAAGPRERSTVAWRAGHGLRVYILEAAPCGELDNWASVRDLGQVG
jgi:hypothetical protein